ncbi:hypothetical protein [Helicovermis profundi]|uniref:Uncharacterized protein n=1 Tax=Helicovermis profundi TaxID=3065157 RepID=A0AAU9EL94_9FIRM|nr:hypothetical protein HLPR_11300 [Clostridia bacterium S502]
MKIKKCYKNAIIETLNCYSLLPLYLEELKLKIDEIKINDGICGIDYSSNSNVQTSNINKLVENTALKNLEDIEKIKSEILITNIKLNRLDSAINSLSKLESEITRYRYIDKLSWGEISSITLYSIRNCQYKSNDAICKLAIVFYGERALIKINDEIKMFADSLRTS